MQPWIQLSQRHDSGSADLRRLKPSRAKVFTKVVALLTTPPPSPPPPLPPEPPPEPPPVSPPPLLGPRPPVGSWLPPIMWLVSPDGSTGRLRPLGSDPVTGLSPA